jgi:hypothetical protein
MIDPTDPKRPIKIHQRQHADGTILESGFSWTKLRQKFKNRPAPSIPEIGVARPFLFWEILKQRF